MLETYVHPSDLNDFIQQKESCHICIVAFMTYSTVLAALCIVRTVYTTHACLTINQFSSHLSCVSTLPKWDRIPAEDILKYFSPSVFSQLTTREQLNRFSWNLTLQKNCLLISVVYTGHFKRPHETFNAFKPTIDLNCKILFSKNSWRKSTLLRRPKMEPFRVLCPTGYWHTLYETAVWSKNIRILFVMQVAKMPLSSLWCVHEHSCCYWEHL